MLWDWVAEGLWVHPGGDSSNAGCLDSSCCGSALAGGTGSWICVLPATFTGTLGFYGCWSLPAVVERRSIEQLRERFELSGIP